MMLLARLTVSRELTPQVSDMYKADAGTDLGEQTRLPSQ